jgi:Gas vesicle synthesis protein GvpL/GvpF
MSTHGADERDAQDVGAAARGFYVYCIGARAELEPLFAAALPAAIEADAPLELIGADDLSAVASSVPLVDYGEESLPTRLADATWTAVRAMRHERVVEHFARRVPVVPLRFGTLYLARANVERMLAEQSAELRAIVARLRGHEEWGVNLYGDRTRLLEKIVELSPRLRELREQAERATPGQAYLLQKKIETMRTDEARAKSRRVAGEIERMLRAVCVAAVRLRVLKDEAAEHGDTLAKFAFLVERARFAEFRAAAERLADEHAAAGFKIELTGPWPAYNFAGAA